ncbi:DUF899 family protein [Kitasatospora viridis]|uniref:Putative dithiol-disulfide oxidoreductase (DUF899 family) n=1 Tax=Kitasatospora viridis TaxID=281105 RepID=A0A561ULI3_9ACTN|nr:DUF899 family protein [Kitasatospora viridis]TWG00232.1 putative dithiol-disulfide oxidoreductase (DUF899 family) [Kitasatospora viridis]
MPITPSPFHPHETRLPGETPEYRAARDAVQLAEIDLMRRREGVAELRRALPPGPAVTDYTFLEGPAFLDQGDLPVQPVRLSSLFTGPDRPLLVYQFMYGKQQVDPCPMCTMWLDGFNGIAHHVLRNADFAVVAAADPEPLRAHARRRGWDRLRLLSCGGNTFKYDLGSEDRAGHQDSTVSVFTRDPDGTVRHRYSVHPRLDADLPERGIDLLSPVWHLLDLTPRGRGEWYPGLDY